MLDDFTCPLEIVQTLEAWLSDKKATSCPSCLIGPLASYYVGHLEEVGEQKKANELKVAFEKGNTLTIAKHMDKIKADVGDKLKQDLVKLDCFAQVHKEA